MKTLGETLALTTQFLKEKGVGVRARREAEELVSLSLNLPRLDLYMQFDRPLEEVELEKIRPLVRRRGRGEPLEYIQGRVSFYHCSFEVNPSVLIPRPESEILLDKACSLLKQLKGGVAWDLCCGSGCLGIGLKKALPQFEVTLADLSQEALSVAMRNGAGNDVEVSYLQGDLLFPFKGSKADVLLCNPPYISQAEYRVLDPSVRDFEPAQALVGGVDGLLFYQRLSQELPEHLNTGAHLFFEIGSGQGESVQKLFTSPWWKRARVEKDFAGHDRFFFLEFE